MKRWELDAIIDKMTEDQNSNEPQKTQLNIDVSHSCICCEKEIFNLIQIIFLKAMKVVLFVVMMSMK